MPSPPRPARLAALALAASALAAAPSLAQVQPLLQQVPQGSPLPRIEPTPPPGVAPGLPQVPQAEPTPAIPNATVAVRRAVIQGAAAFPPAELQKYTAGLTGPSVPLSAIEAARVAILNQYRSQGYVLTTVSAVIDRDGTVRFSVVEGRIADVKLEGDIGPAGVQVLRFLRPLRDMPIVDAASLERALLLANDIPGVSVKGVLRPSTTDPGALTLVAQAKHKIASGLITADNRGFRLNGPQEGLAIVDLNSVTALGEQTELSWYHTAANTQNFGQGSFQFFVGESGLRFRLYGGYGESRPSGFLRDLKYEGFTAAWGGSASYPIIRSREQNLYVSAYFDGIQSIVKAIGVSNALERHADDLRIGRLGADYALLDTLVGDSRPGINTVSIRLSQGLPFLGGTRSGDPTATRPNERTDFFKATAELVRTQTLFSPWDGATVAVKGLLAGQVSGDVLPPVEKFYLGGSAFTRGFYSGQATGDTAIAATIELQLNTTYETVLFERPFAIGAQFYAFYDRGHAWQNQSSDPNFRLSSEGGGVRLNITPNTEFDLEGVIRNTRLPEGVSGNVKAIKADALYWRVLARF